jgi:plasmid stabilization system protein ParE
MNVEWSEDAYRDYDEILGYLVHEFGTRSAVNFQRRLNHSIEVLKTFPLVGRSEYLNEATRIEYRSLSCRQYRIIYTVMPDRILILSFWNNRRNPEDLRNLLNLG